MHLYPSKHSLELLIAIAETGRLPFSGFEHIPVDVFYAAPYEPVEVWDRIHNGSVFEKNVHLIASEWAGVEPRIQSDHRRYRKTVEVDGARQRVTFHSSLYKLAPVSVILQGRCIGDRVGKETTRFRVIICDADNRSRWPAFLEEDISSLEEEEVHDRPPAEVERTLIHA